ncbi:MAG: tryptophan--tRNA ligase [Candidatus Kinetoplastibacterium crithidii]|nr:MAG: tryptophan--tRNA ligase [Candidatus Kinetoplastibacterium crithidii]
MKTCIVTGITTSGTPHLGNYAGAIRPAIQASLYSDTHAFFFLADYHALIKCSDPIRLYRSRLEIAATWLAAGLDVDRVVFYRQSDIPEILELCWILTCSTAKGLMNRAHAYKALVSQNLSKSLDADDGVSMGLFSYPILMAADILMFKANKVPVGKDQIQHLEMARDIAQKFNHIYNVNFFILPEAFIVDNVATLPGLDGRKMSKSYNNTIPLFEGGAKNLRSSIMRIVTDSSKSGDPKNAEDSHLYILFRAFATEEESEAYKLSLNNGMSWGEAKNILYEKIESELLPMRERYNKLISKPDLIENILQSGAQKARFFSKSVIKDIRDIVGLRDLNVDICSNKKRFVNNKNVYSNNSSNKDSRFVCYRDNKGHFKFRLISSSGKDILKSRGSFSDANNVGFLIKDIKMFLQKIKSERMNESEYFPILENYNLDFDIQELKKFIE